jgi:hypothetical protein
LGVVGLPEFTYVNIPYMIMQAFDLLQQQCLRIIKFSKLRFWISLKLSQLAPNVF